MIHKTRSGYIEKIDSYGHGKSPKSTRYALRPATLVADDGDGYFTVWSYTGKKSDAIDKILEFQPIGVISHIEGNFIFGNNGISSVDIY